MNVGDIISNILKLLWRVLEKIDYDKANAFRDAVNADACGVFVSQVGGDADTIYVADAPISQDSDIKQ